MQKLISQSMYRRVFHIFLLNVHEDSFGISNVNYFPIRDLKPPKYGVHILCACVYVFMHFMCVVNTGWSGC